MESKAHTLVHSSLLQELWGILERAQKQLNDLTPYRACHKTKWINKMMDILWELCTSSPEELGEPKQTMPQNRHDKNERKIGLEISLSHLQNENNRLALENGELKEINHKMILQNEIQKVCLKEMENREQQIATLDYDLREQLHSKEKEMHAIKEENTRLKQIESSLKEDLRSQETDFKQKIESLHTHLLYLRLNNESLRQKRLVAAQQVSELRQESNSLGNRKREEKTDQQKSKHEEMLTQQKERRNTSTKGDNKESINMPYSMLKRTFTKENDLIEENKTLEKDITKSKQQNRKLLEITTLKRKHSFKTVAGIDSKTTCRDEDKTPSPVSDYKVADFRDELAIEREKTNELKTENSEIQRKKKKLKECYAKALRDIKEKDLELKWLKEHVAKLQTQTSRRKLDAEKLNKELTLEKSTDVQFTVISNQEKFKHQRNVVSARKYTRRNDTENREVCEYLDVEIVSNADAKLKKIEKEKSQLREEIEILREEKRRRSQDFREEKFRLREETEQIQKKLNEDILCLRNQLVHQTNQTDKLRAKDAELENLRKEKQRQTQEFQEKERDLRKEIENTKNNIKNELQELSRKLERQKLEKEYSDALRNEKERYREKEEALKNQNTILQEKLETLQTELNCVKTEVASKEELNKQCQELKLEIDHLRTKHSQLTSELTKCQKKALLVENSLESKLHELTKKNQKLVKDLEIEKTVTQRKTKNTNSELIEEKCQNEDTKVVDKLKEKLESTTKELEATKRELEETKSRLSRVMGDRLTDNNPNIADLSDKNRPTKLSERYQELYDNQWTDAFETASKLCDEDEERTIRTLQEILLDTMTFCKEEAEKQMRLIINSFCKDKDIPSHLLKQLKDSRKSLAEEYGRLLLQEYTKLLHKEDTEIAKISCKIPNFVEECFCICWLMAVQDPPVVFGACVKRGADFNKGHYKAYTKGGDTVNYVVWPVVLLHEGGPVLCKGVAQGQMA